MALNDNKVRVTSCFGAGCDLGVMDGQVNMVVKYGIQEFYIVATGDSQAALSFSQGGTEVRQAYYKDLVTEYNHATGIWSYPSGDGAYEFGHHQGVMANGIPVMIGTGHSYMGPNSTVYTYGR